MKRWLAALFYMLWVLDAVFTCMFVTQYGPEAEANPLMRMLIERLGLAAFVFLKMIPAMMLIGLHRHVRPCIYAFLNAVMLPVVIMGGMLAFS